MTLIPNDLGDLVVEMFWLFWLYWVSYHSLSILFFKVRRFNRINRGYLDVVARLGSIRSYSYPIPRTYKLTQHFKRSKFWIL